ncbi:MAG: IS982 family transposase, partial [Acidobacteria bacterium]|nr:IS982 family transposase [Acidobacteriota bacterium]MCA1638544.1 IS982 family transposase [Acidobacteriota bacterium]
MNILRKSYPVRHGGFAPALSDEEVIPIEICGEFFKHSTDKDLFNYFKAHYQSWFPNLSERTLFVRQAANLWQFKALIQQQIVRQAEQLFANLQVIDTIPVSVCAWIRGIRDKCFPSQADYGYCAAKDLHYYGFKLGLRCSRIGMITFAWLLPARPHDVNFTEELVNGSSQTILGDKGFLDPFRQTLLEDRYGTKLIVPKRKNMKKLNQEPIDKMTAKMFRKVRKVIETVGSHLTERFNLNKIRVRDLWHFQSRLIRKILAHTVTVFLNLQLGRKPLDLDGLVSN